MIYTKPIEGISYQNVVDFCAERYRENIHLDYKKEIDRSLTKTIAAMANTWGGVIVIGIDEEDSKPKLPVVGFPYEEHVRERINNLILGNIMPPLFPEIQICASPDGTAAFAVVRVAQSQLTPHAIRGNTQVYVRTDTSNEPEELATLDRIQWLAERRRKSEELKLSFFRKADERFALWCNRNGIGLVRGDSMFSMTPLYPFDLLRAPDKLRKETLEKIRVREHGTTFPTLLHYTGFEAVQGGTYGIFVKESIRYICYEELNQFGFFYHREDLSRTESKEEGKEEHYAFLHTLMVQVDLFLESMAKLYREIGYWGMLEARIVLRNLNDVGFRDLPAPRGYAKWENIVSYPVDNSLEFSKVLSFSELQDQRVELVVGLLLEISWALGFSHLNGDSIRKLLQEACRA